MLQSVDESVVLWQQNPRQLMIEGEGEKQGTVAVRRVDGGMVVQKQPYGAWGVKVKHNLGYCCKQNT